MTDLVERLRSKSPYLHGSSAERAMAEAATEIEQLRAEKTYLGMTYTQAQTEIERLLDAFKAIEWHSIDHTDACRMAGKARAALEPKPMTGIVERLRASYGPMSLLHEAATEIERLTTDRNTLFGEAHVLRAENERLKADTNRAWLGLATTRELLDELRARIEMHALGGLDYRTVDGETFADEEPKPAIAPCDDAEFGMKA